MDVEIILVPSSGETREAFLRTVDGDNNGTVRCDIGAVEFGSGTTTTVDLDSDIKTDVAVYQTSSGNWFFVQSRRDLINS